MNRLLSHLLAVALLPVIAPAQDRATTLFACSRDAAVVVRATVVAATDPSSDWHRLEFRADEVLKGGVEPAFFLMEPAGACCGRSLFALAPGDRCLLFLRRTGATLHPLGGARGVLADDAAVVAHVRTLLSTANTDVTAVLVAALDATEARIANDAAEALAVLPVLAPGAADRLRLVDALVRAVHTGRTAAAPLADAVARLQDPAMLDALAVTYLSTPRDDQAGLLRRAFARCDADSLLGIVPTDATDTARQLRAAQLFAELPMDRAAPVLRTMLVTTPCPKVKLCTAEALLGAGASADELRNAMPAEVLELALRRRDTAKTFRSIRPARP